MNLTDFPNPERVTAELVEMRGRYWIDRALLDAHVDAKAIVDYGLNRLALDMRAKLAAVGSESIDIERAWPADWWQAVRQRWAPRWWLKRHPVRMERVSVHRKVYAAVCPHMKIDEQQRHLEFMFMYRKPAGFP